MSEGELVGVSGRVGGEGVVAARREVIGGGVTCSNFE